MALVDLDVFCQQNHQEIDDLAQVFGDYEPTRGFDRSLVRRWLENFDPGHWALALKLARRIQYYGKSQIHGLVVNLYKLVEQKKEAMGVDDSAAFYLPFGRTEESGAEVLRSYRNVNRLRSYSSQFVSLSEIQGKLIRSESPVLFFLDDFVGTGNQVCTGWRQMISQVVPEYIPCFLAVIAASAEGIRRVERETPMEVICVHSLGSRSQLTKTKCRGLSAQERTIIRRYCDKARNMPLGYGNLALLLSFAHGTPNNTISVIRGSKKQKPFVGLLPDWEDLA